MFKERDQENTESLQTADGDKGRIETSLENVFQHWLSAEELPTWNC